MTDDWFAAQWQQFFWGINTCCHESLSETGCRDNDFQSVRRST
jgi:hypothetical protein